ncbi:MAG: endonuclease III domain-containing protein, partial [Candidatus Omnitrophica bacterium]|nr:endonuclease III domain-containing protein [Candidatus Omnitrophota bacterium]
MRKTLLKTYRGLYAFFGPQKWWPADTPFEVIVGAILTQNTAWSNVEKAIKNLKACRLVSPKALSHANHSKIAKLIRPSGYYNIKIRRLKNFLAFLNGDFGGSVSRMSKAEPMALRKALLGINGIGPETADSILLYALNKPFFVIDTYTRRIFLRHKLIKKDASYDELQRFFMSNLPNSAKLYNEYHA